MIRRGLSRWYDLLLAHPRAVLGAAAALTALAGLAGSGLELRTSRSELVRPDDPEQVRYRRLLAEFRGQEPLIVALASAPAGEESGTASPSRRQALVEAVDAVAATLADEPSVAGVFAGIDPDWLLDRMPRLIPPERVASLLELAEQRLVPPGTRLEIDSFAAVDRALAAWFERELRTASGVDSGAPGDGPTALARWFRFEARLFRDPRGVERDLLGPGDGPLSPATIVDRLAGMDGVAGGAHLLSRDGRTAYVIVTPAAWENSLAVQRPLVDAVTARVERVLENHPGITFTLTGPPALAVEEMNAIRRDSIATSLAALAGVSILVVFAFRWRTHAPLVLGALACGVVWSMGAVRFELGYLNLITSACVSILIGVGIAYGIHPVSEYELLGAHLSPVRDNVREAFERTGAAVAISALTTAGAFFCILLMDFRGFAELGLVAGSGVLLCLLAAVVLLPALLVVYGDRRARGGRSHRRADAVAAVDRIWVERIAGRICRAPRLTVAAALVLTVAAVAGAIGLRFNPDLLDLLPRRSPALLALERMIEDGSLSPYYNLVVARERSELDAFAARAEAEPAIARFESVTRLLPADDPGRAERERRLAEVLDRIAVAPAPSPPSPGERVTALTRVERAVEEAADAAFAAGRADLVAPVEVLLEAVGEARAAAQAIGPQAEALARVERRLLATGADVIARWRRELNRPPHGIDDLPAALRARFVTRSGRLVGYLYPAGDVFDPADLSAFNQASSRVSATATGFPWLFELMSRRITGGFSQAVFWGAVLVLVLLLVDLRSVRDAVLALIPLAVGVAWMLGSMRVFGLRFNLGNLVAVPLILGVGIDNGVHVIHRFRLEGNRGMATVLRHTGRAILISSLTTMIGFGSLALASHRGMQSLGWLLLLGVGACLISATVVLPNLLIVLGLARE